MVSLSSVFFVTLSALLGQGTIVSGTEKVSSSNVCAFEPDAIVSDACASYSELDTLNTVLRPYIQSITQQTEFFSYYRLNLFNKQCPFWSDHNGMCGNIACAVNTLDNEDDIPLVWRAQELGKLETPESSRTRRNVQTLEQIPDSGLATSIEPDYGFDELEYCFPEEPHSDAQSHYVSLVDNPERFTGYSGVGAQQVWETIYRENCFTRQNAGPGGADPLMSSLHSSSHMVDDLRRVLQQHDSQHAFQQAIARREPGVVDSFEFEDECLEKRVFYHVVSGMHASISSHLCWDHLNQTTGEWGPNPECYRQRVYNYPERVSNIYFNYALLLRATSKLRSFMNHVQFKSADPSQDELANRLIVSLAAAIPNSPKIFDETVMFNSHDSHLLKTDFRDRFRNISRIMDCVGCDKCRLWGKIQTAGYGTALKILFELDESNPSKSQGLTLRRTELVALINTLARVSHSLYVHQQFKRMMGDEEDSPRSPSKLPVRSGLVGGSKKGLPAALMSDPPSKERPHSDSETVPLSGKKHPRPPQDEPETLGDIFWTEFDLVYRMFKYILSTWWSLPTTLWRITLFECTRIWHYWLGLEPPTGGWFFRLPDMSDLRDL